MQSELDILRRNGLPEAPEKAIPSPPEATFAKKAYESVKEQFDTLFADVSSYAGQSISDQVADQLRKKIDSCIQLAGKVRVCASALKAHPNSFSREGSAAVFFAELASKADEAYAARLAELTDLEMRFAKLQYPRTRITLGTLLSHEGRKGGHVLANHVAWGMEDFRARFLEEEQQGTPKDILSAFIDRATAEEVIGRVIERNRYQIDKAKEGQRIVIPIEESKDIGYFKVRGLPPKLTKSGRLIIFKDSTHPSGCRIKTVELGQL